MLAAPLIEMGERHDVGVRLGMFFTILAMGALSGPPISGAINTATGGFKAVGYYAGACAILDTIPDIVGLISLLCLRSHLQDLRLSSL